MVEGLLSVSASLGVRGSCLARQGGAPGSGDRRAQDGVAVAWTRLTRPHANRHFRAGCHRVSRAILVVILTDMPDFDDQKRAPNAPSRRRLTARTCRSRAPRRAAPRE